MAVSRSSEASYIEEIVRVFYAKATIDVLIGYHFRKIALAEKGVHPLKPPLEAFDHHLPRINLFWENQLLGTPLPKDSPNFDIMHIHKRLLVRKGEVNRWIALFKETLEENEDHPLKEKWLQKIDHFQKVFLESKLLFP